MKIRFTRRYTTRGGRKGQGLSPGIQSDSVRWTALDDAFRPFAAASLAAMLSAAYDAPGVGARRPSLLVLWIRSVVSPPRGQLTASFVDLPTLLSAVHEAIPRIRVFEDYEPDDPRVPVHASMNGHRYRIHPGDVTNAMGLLHAVQMTAHAIDAFMLETKGFAATDLLEAALSYGDWRLAQLERVWPPVDETDDGQERENTEDDPRVVEIQTAVAIHQAAATEWLTRCEYPERAGLAWAWATTKAASLRFDMQPMAHTMGPVLAVDSALGVIPIPAAEVLNAMGVAMGYLALEARDVPEAQRSLQVNTEEVVLRVLNMPAVPDHNGALVTVITPGARHVFALGIVATLEPEELRKKVNEATDELMEFEASDIEHERVDSSASVYRILLYGGPFRLARWWNGSIVQASVYDFVSIVRDVQQRERTYDLLWEFLMAITDQAQRAGFMAISFLDAWHHWLAYGVLNPVSAEMAIFVSPADNQQWMRAAAWDPIEETLYKASLPPTREWAWTHLDDPERATLVDPWGTPVMIATNPPVVVVVPRHELVGWEDLDPAFCTGVGDGILATCTSHARIAEILRASGGDPTIVVVEFANDEEADPGSAGVTVVTDQPRPMIVLRLSSSWLTELIRNPKTAHAAVGRALFAGLALVSTADLSVVQQPFLEAWNDSPPIAMMGLQESTLKSPVQDIGLLPDMSSALNHALAQDAATAGIQPGTYRGDAMVGIARMLLPILQTQVKALMTSWSADAIDVVVEHLNAAHGERTRARQQLGAALRAPWSEVWREEALRGPHGAERTRPLEVLLEYLIARETCGVMRPDRFDVGYGRALVNRLLQVGTILSSAVGGLAEWTINVTPWRTLTVEPVESVSGRTIDWTAYWQMEVADHVRTREPFTGEDEIPEGFPHHARATVAFQSTRSIPDLPQSWNQVDEQMRLAWGTGVDGLAAVLSTAVSWNEDGGTNVVRVRWLALRDEAATWSGVPTLEIEAAIDRLSVDADRLRGESLPAWEIERRAYRVAVRPLIRQDDELLLIPWLIYVAQEIWNKVDPTVKTIF